LNDYFFPNLRRLLTQRSTPGGLLLYVVLVVSGAVAAGSGVSNENQLYRFPVLLFGFFFIDWTVGSFWKPRVKVERELPARCAAGARVAVRGRVTNTGRLSCYDLALTERPSDPPMRIEPSPLVDRLAPGESVELACVLEPRARGSYDFEGPRAFSEFPFGVYMSSRKIEAAGRLLVYPRFEPLASIDLPVGRKHQPGGLALVSEVGDSGEFIGNREYRTGDRPRDIAHAAWARRGGTPVVREFQQEYLCRIALIADTFGEDLEAAISLGAAVADCLSRQEYVIDVFAAGPDLYHFQAGRSLAYLENILDVLACIERCKESPFARLAPALQEELAQISTAVCILLDWDEERARFVRSLESQGVAVKVVVVRARPCTLDPRGVSSMAGPATLLSPKDVERGVETL